MSSNMDDANHQSDEDEFDYAAAELTLFNSYYSNHSTADDSSVEQDFDVLHRDYYSDGSDPQSSDDEEVEEEDDDDDDDEDYDGNNSNDKEECIESVCTTIVEKISNNKYYKCTVKFPKHRREKNENIPDEKVPLIAEAVRKNTNISEISLKGFLFTPKGFTILMDTILQRKKIESFGLLGRRSGRNDVIDITVLQVLGNKLKEYNGPLRILDLTRSKIGWNGMITIFESLLNNTGIDCIDLSRTIEWNRKSEESEWDDEMNESDTEDDAKQPGQASECKSTDDDDHMDSSDDNNTVSLLTKAAWTLNAVLKCHTTLTNMELSYNPLGDEFVMTIAEALFSSGCKLRYLRLIAVNMTDVGAMALGCSLSRNTSLRELEINKNCFSGAAVVVMGDALKWNRTLTHLEMRDHLFYGNLLSFLQPKLIDFRYLALFFTAMEYNPTLQYLGIFDPHFDYEKHLSTDIQQSILDSLEYNDTIIDLNGGMVSAPKTIRRQIRRAGDRKRIAPRKGIHERRAIYDFVFYNNNSEGVCRG